MLSPIKIILIIPLLLLILLFVLKMQNRIVYRFSLILVALAGIFFVINPDFTTQLAHALNVGRGTDLLFYLCAIAGFMSVLILYSKLRKIEATQTQIIQNAAVESGRNLAKTTTN
jgi:hypothetical protein